MNETLGQLPKPLGDMPVAPSLTPEEEEREALQADYVPLGAPLKPLALAEAILKHPCRVIHEVHHGQASRLTWMQLGLAVACLLAYGVTVGMFSSGTQLWAAPIKIMGGVLVSALICLPSLFVLSCLAGADGTLHQMVGWLTGMLTISGLLLLAFGPVSWVFAQSTESTVFMGGLHLVLWGVAVHYGLQYLRKSVLLLNGRRGTHLGVWSVIFVLVTLQMTTALRPILGRSDQLLNPEKKFFLAHWGEQFNANMD